MRESGLLVPAALLVVIAAVLLPSSRGIQPGGSEAAAPGEAPAAPGPPESGETASVAPEETSATLLARFFGLPRQDRESQEALIGRVKEAAKRHGYTLDTLVILLPDPIDSHSRWLFDPIQEAIQRAAAANAYALDRFYVPDWRPGQPPGARLSRVHEAWPGVILFRQLPGSANTAHRLLVTFLVFETPTQGVHLEAFREALRFINAWSPDKTSPLKILGPTFSGTSPSLRIALRDADQQGLLPLRVRVISGSATSVNNKPIIEDAVGPGRVEYAATVLSNRDMLQGVVEHLQKLGPVAPRELALLVEQNTAYGQSEYRPAGERSALETALQIGFPLHISRIRAAATGRDRAAADLPLAPPKTQALSLKEEGPVIDQLPMFGESTSSAYIELLLLNTLETLRREHITTVGLLATDTRDKLFLAQMLARHCPNMRVFTIETDLLYAHPDYSTYMRGMIVASSYPLFNPNQLWTQPSIGEHRRFQFAASFTTGLFNAFQALLRGDGVTVNDLVEYASPLQAGCPNDCAPPLWISVNGNAGLWPLDVDGNKGLEYILRVPVGEPRHEELERARMRPVPVWATVTLVALHIGVWLQLVAYVVGCLRPERAIRRYCPPSMARTFVRSANPRRYLLAAFVALLLLLISADLLWIWAVVFAGNTRHVAAAVAIAGVTVLAVLAAIADIARRRLPPLASAIVVRTPSAFGIRMFLYRAIYLGLLAAMVVQLLLALSEVAAGVLQPHDLVRQQHMLFLFNRSVDLANGVSPAVPILLLCGALYLWGFQHFRTRGVPSRSILSRRLGELDVMRSRPVALEPAATPAMPATGPSLDTMASLRLGVLVVVVVLQLFWYIGLMGMTGVTTIESAEYTRFFQYGSMLLQALVAVSIAQFLFVWARTRRRLECFAGLAGVSGPLSAAFARLPLNVRRLGVFARVPKLEDLEDAVAAACAVAAPLKLAGIGRADVRALLRQPELGRDDSLPADLLAGLNAAFAEEKATDRGRTFSDTKTWAHVLAFTAKARMLAFAVTRLGDEAIDKPTNSWLERVDDLVAMNIALIVREMGGRLVASMLLSMVMALMILASHTWYPAQPRQVLLGFSWACIIAGVAASVRVFIQMDRNEVISHIAGTTPNRTTWDLAFLSRLLLWVVVPLLSLFAAQFPDVGRTLLQWLQPIQKALP